MENARINLAHPSFVARPSELESFNGAMARLAKRMGPAFGANHKVHDVVHEGPARKRRIKTGGLQKFVSLGHTRHLLLLRTGQLQRLSSRLSE